MRQRFVHGCSQLRILASVSALAAIVCFQACQLCWLHNHGSWQLQQRWVCRNTNVLNVLRHSGIRTCSAIFAASVASGKEAEGKQDEGNERNDSLNLPVLRNFLYKNLVFDSSSVSNGPINTRSQVNFAGGGRRLGATVQKDRPMIGVAGRRLAGVVGLVGLTGFITGQMLGRSDQPSPGQQGELAQSGQFVKPEWAYSNPIIQQGSVLLSRPGAYFSNHQQYFHKAIILIINHGGFFDQGIILNRPTSFLTTQLGIPGPPWNVWYGGDCEGLRSLGRDDGPMLFCLHTLAKFASASREVIKGVYLIDFDVAQDKVSRGDALTTDFMLFFGYCGWGAGQLQRELDAQDAWKMASVDSDVIVRELREETMELRALPQIGLDDGVAVWRHLYALLDAGFPRQVSGMGDMIPADISGDKMADMMLRLWVEENLKA